MRLPLALLAAIALASLAAPLIAALLGADPAAVDLLDRFAGPVGGASAGHRRIGPRHAAAPARRRPRVADHRHRRGGDGGGARRRGRAGCRLSRRLGRPRADAADRWGHRPAAAAAADRVRRARPRKARHFGAGHRIAGDQPAAHRRADRAGRLDHRGAAGARRDARHPPARFRPRRPEPRRRARRISCGATSCPTCWGRWWWRPR